jgi:NADPH-dependent curcumin reductase CurA
VYLYADNRKITLPVADTNRQFRLASRPSGMPGRDNWDLVEEPQREPGDGEVLVKVLLLSLDPAMRGWMNDVPSYLPPVGIGEVMRAIGVGQVVASRHPEVREGDYVTGLFGIQEYATLSGDALTVVDHRMAPLATYLNVLGLPGMTAYFGLLDIGRPNEGETVVVSGAAGAVGATAGQIAKLKGCRAVGIAGGPEKCRMLVDEFGFDAAIDYKNDELRPALREKCPDRVNVYFDNVGGDVLDAVLGRLARGARIVICGAVSQYNADRMKGPSNYMALLVRRARMEGFVVFDYADRYAEAAREMAGWIAEGKLKSREETVAGIETFPDTLLRLFRGENMGKLILEVAPA